MSHPGLRIVFMGSSEFSLPTLRRLWRYGRVIGVVTQPDRPKGRGRRVVAPAVKRVAQELGIGRILQPDRVRRPAVREEIRAWAPDVIVVAAYGQILSPKLLRVPPLGCLNVHASLLPKYRGAAPVQWAIVEGERESGVTIMQMDAGMDTGDILLSRSLPLVEGESAGELHDRLAPLGAEAIIDALEGIRAGRLTPQPQDHGAATYARMLTKEDGLLDFKEPGAALDRRIRGFDPWPGAYTHWQGGRLSLYRSRPLVEERGRPGEILCVDRRGLLIACGSGAVRCAEVQWAGHRRMTAEAFACGHPLRAGDLLGQ